MLKADPIPMHQFFAPSEMFLFFRFSAIPTGWLAIVLAVLISGPLVADVVINEIHYDPADETSREQFVELYNTGNVSVDLAGAHFDHGITFTFPAGTTIEAGGFLVIAQDPVTLLSRFGTSSLGPYTDTLKNSGERVRLRDVFGVTIDEVTYSDHFPWPTQAAGGGRSMELIHPGLDNDLGASWRSSGSGSASESGGKYVFGITAKHIICVEIPQRHQRTASGLEK